MISAEERRRLMDRVGGDLLRPLGAVLKCAAGLAVLVIIAAGPWAFLSASGPTAATGEHPAPQAHAALAESKRVFDERRSTYEARRQSSAADPSIATRQWLAVE